MVGCNDTLPGRPGEFRCFFQPLEHHMSNVLSRAKFVVVIFFGMADVCLVV